MLATWGTLLIIVTNYVWVTGTMDQLKKSKVNYSFSQDKVDTFQLKIFIMSLVEAACQLGGSSFSKL